MAVWSDDLGLDHPEMDADHQQLVLLVNEFDYAIRHARPAETIRRALDDLMAFAGRHFCHEERLMRQSAYPDFRAHKRSHDQLIRDLRLRIREIDAGTRRLDDGVVTWLKTWVGTHIRTDDRALAVFLAAQPELSRTA